MWLYVLMDSIPKLRPILPINLKYGDVRRFVTTNQTTKLSKLKIKLQIIE